MSKNISGFPEFLPREQIAFDEMIEMIKSIFKIHGFIPLETSAVERASTLLSKGNDHEIYGLHKLRVKSGAMDGNKNDEKNDESDGGGLGLRFDLTVPLARYVSSNYGSLNFPYKRYQIAPVWRGERPQAGRYRQFYQCDVDIIADVALPLEYDAEILSVIFKIFKKIGLKFKIKVNNINILHGIVGIKTEPYGDDDLIIKIARAIDKKDKLSVEKIGKEIKEILDNHQVKDKSGDSYSGDTYFTHVKYDDEYDDDKTFDRYVRPLIMLLQNNTECKFAAWREVVENILLSSLKSNLSTQKSNSIAQIYAQKTDQGIQNLSDVLNYAVALGVDEENIVVDPFLARGLNYYTGTVFEVVFDDHRELGAVCSGGRYDNLVSNFINNKKLPGVGMSVGISRIFPKLLEIGAIKEADSSTIADVLITTQNRDLIDYYLKVAILLREGGIKTDIYLCDKAFKNQMKYSSKCGFKFVVIADENEFEMQSVIVKNMDTGDQEIVKIEELEDNIKNKLEK